MPFTFAHPAAVLPLRKLCPSFLNFPALIVGSMMPDLGYYMHNWLWSIAGHSFSGSLSFDLPAGLFALAFFYLSIRPVARLFPSPHREALMSLCQKVRLPSLKELFVASGSILAGAWTHIIWDGFTHANGWCVHKFAAITPTLFEIGSYQVTVWHILQHASTIFGLLALLIAYRAFVRSQVIEKSKNQSSFPKIFTLCFLSIIPIFPAAYNSLTAFKHGLSLASLDTFIFDTTVQYVCYLVSLLVAAGIVASIVEYWVRNFSATQASASPAALADDQINDQLFEVTEPNKELLAASTDVLPTSASQLLFPNTKAYMSKH